ncbi:MAG: threonylcarbamoyl-AMP synthase [Candidatus Cellulosilyticum pullistercoris]|uniref:Threonylcarbamoyl-AMP synthase n=1 Tax=Candidatus Cellulosilyticum pullistercoris TaxID=2838521 RepID=A0A9E2KCN7_9FIRM|nr:threonylcarbamoyl-AMP synthase [Candidatus Cellulosilyticum pullistercoris]
MKTVIISDKENLQQAAEILKEGGLVASPTETVYGLCANALDEAAVKNIYKAKGRPSDNPLIVHIGDLDMLKPLVQEVSPIAKKLMDTFWPGPMTLIFKASDLVPKVVTGGLDTVAVRFPSHPTINKLIKTSGLPLAAPSANTSGKPSPTNFTRVYEDLNGKIDCIIEGDHSEYGVESTVVDTVGDIATILRPGGITFEMLEEVLGKVMMDPALGHKLKEGEVPRAPGMKYTHYSPNAEVIIVKGENDQVIPFINTLVKKQQSKGKTVGVLATDETASLFMADKVISVGTESNPLTIASNLFEVLRSFDDAHIDMVYSLAFKETGIGKAIMNRLEKSAGYHIIEV